MSHEIYLRNIFKIKRELQYIPEPAILLNTCKSLLKDNEKKKKTASHLMQAWVTRCIVTAKQQNHTQFWPPH